MKYKGFTLIELLIVIAILGVLAVAVLAAINPIEQLNRSKDSGSKSDVEQFLGAIDRFYAAKGYYPWYTSASTPVAELSWTSVGTTWEDSGGASAVVEKLSSGTTAEIKASFVSRLTSSEYNTMFIYNKGTSGDSTYACFKPKSKSSQLEAQLRCSETSGSLPSDFPEDDACPGTCTPAAPENCFLCLP